MDELDASNPLFAEIIAERASAYFTTIRKMETALAALAAHDRSVAPDPQNTPRRQELLAEAAEQAWFFIIQREAMRLTCYDELLAEFGVPEEVQNRLGPNNRAV